MLFLCVLASAAMKCWPLARTWGLWATLWPLPWNPRPRRFALKSCSSTHLCTIKPKILSQSSRLLRPTREQNLHVLNVSMEWMLTRVWSHISVCQWKTLCTYLRESVQSLALACHIRKDKDKATCAARAMNKTCKWFNQSNDDDRYFYQNMSCRNQPDPTDQDVLKAFGMRCLSGCRLKARLTSNRSASFANYVKAFLNRGYTPWHELLR